MKSTLATSLGSNPTIEKNIPDDQVWIDDIFYVKATRFGLYTSVLKEPYGVTQITRWHLKCLQEGTLDDHTYVTSVSMGVKL